MGGWSEVTTIALWVLLGGGFVAWAFGTLRMDVGPDWLTTLLTRLGAVSLLAGVIVAVAAVTLHTV